jgi:hypothetical protein
LGNLEVSFLKEQFFGYRVVNKHVIPPNLDTILGNVQVSFLKEQSLGSE